MTRHLHGAHHERHMTSLGKAVMGLALTGGAYLVYMLVAALWGGVSGAFLILWVLGPMATGIKFGAVGMKAGGMAGLTGMLLLGLNLLVPYAVYLGGDAPTLPVYLITPFIHWFLVFAFLVLMRAVR